jgi:hypothetical protein
MAIADCGGEEVKDGQSFFGEATLSTYGLGSVKHKQIKNMVRKESFTT